MNDQLILLRLRSCFISKLSFRPLPSIVFINSVIPHIYHIPSPPSAPLVGVYSHRSAQEHIEHGLLVSSIQKEASNSSTWSMKFKVLQLEVEEF